MVGNESTPGYHQGRNEVYATIYLDGDFPVNTVLVISGLGHEDFLVEIKAVAVPP